MSKWTKYKRFNSYRSNGLFPGGFGGGSTLLGGANVWKYWLLRRILFF